MLTPREQDVLNLIKQNPLISQQQLAQKLGITRSAVAGYIVKLNEKGVIRGRGYVLNDHAYAVIIGGANIDIQAKTTHPLELHDSNPGSVTLSPGGVARNIAENLARLNTKTHLISVVGTDSNGSWLIEQTRAAGVDTSSIMVHPGVTSSYVTILNADGNMHVAINDMAILDALTPDTLTQHKELINHSSVVLIDCNVNERTLAHVFEQHAHQSIFVDCVSVAKVMKIKPFLANVHTLKPNREEASRLSGIEINTHDDLPRVADYFHEAGVKQVFMSLGADGLFYSSAQTRGVMTTRKPVTVTNVTGAGDAMLAGLMLAFMQQHTTLQSAQLGMAAALNTLQHIQSVNPNQNTTTLQTIIKEYL